MKTLLQILIVLISLQPIGSYSQSLLFFEDTEAAYSIKQTADGNIVIMFGNKLIKMDLEGYVLWETVFDPVIWSDYWEIYELADGSFRIIGNNYYEISSTGEILATIAFPDIDVKASCIAPGGFLVKSNYGDYGFFKISNSGEVLWNYLVPDAGNGFVHDLMFDGTSATYLRSGQDYFGSFATFISTFDTLGNVLLDSILNLEKYNMVSFISDGYLMGNSESLIKNKNDNVLDWESFSPAYADSLPPFLELPSGNIIWVKQDYIGGSVCHNLAYFSPSGENFYNSPPFLTDELEFYFISDFILISENLLAFTGERTSPFGNDCFVFFTDTLATLLNIHVEGKIYYDENENTVYDTGEPTIPNVFVKSSPLDFYGISNADGDYGSNIFSAGTYENQTILPLYWDISEPEIYTVVLNDLVSGDTVSNYDYRLSYSTSVMDIELTLYQPDIFSLTENYITGTVNNFGNQTLDYATISLHIPPYMLVDSTAPMYISFIDSIITFDINDFDPFESYNFKVYYGLDTSEVTIGDTIHAFAQLSDILDDIALSDNIDSISSEIYGPYDPNHKSVSPAGIGDAGTIDIATETLEYLIEFQNIGTAPAINVNIIDTLDSDLIFTSLQMLAASHSYTIEVPAPNVLIWHFENINLPDSATEPLESCGYLIYRMKIEEALPAGTEITNNAYIYFDNNEAIVTNTTKTTLELPNSIQEFNKYLSVYPNPAGEYIILQLEEENTSGCNIKVNNINGTVIINEILEAGETIIHINLPNFPDGIYFINSYSLDGLAKTNGKFIVTH